MIEFLNTIAKLLGGTVSITLKRSFQWTGITPMLITITRTSATKDGIFGNLCIDGKPFKCVTMENLNKEINAGVYDLDFTYSPHFNRVMPHLIVPDRDLLAGGDAGIRIHWANFPAQLDGCIATGTKVDGDSIDESLVPFNQLYSIIYGQTPIKVKIIEDYA